MTDSKANIQLYIKDITGQSLTMRNHPEKELLVDGERGYQSIHRVFLAGVNPGEVRKFAQMIDEQLSSIKGEGGVEYHCSASMSGHSADWVLCFTAKPEGSGTPFKLKDLESVLEEAAARVIASKQENINQEDIFNIPIEGVIPLSRPGNVPLVKPRELPPLAAMDPQNAPLGRGWKTEVQKVADAEKVIEERGVKARDALVAKLTEQLGDDAKKYSIEVNYVPGKKIGSTQQPDTYEINLPMTFQVPGKLTLSEAVYNVVPEGAFMTKFGDSEDPFSLKGVVTKEVLDHALGLDYPSEAKAPARNYRS